MRERRCACRAFFVLFVFRLFPLFERIYSRRCLGGLEIFLAIQRLLSKATATTVRRKLGGQLGLFFFCGNRRSSALAFGLKLALRYLSLTRTPACSQRPTTKRLHLQLRGVRRDLGRRLRAGDSDGAVRRQSVFSEDGAARICGGLLEDGTATNRSATTFSACRKRWTRGVCGGPSLR